MYFFIRTHDDGDFRPVNPLLLRHGLRLELEPDRLEIGLEAAAAREDVFGGDEGAGAEVGLGVQIEKADHPGNGIRP